MTEPQAPEAVTPPDSETSAASVVRHEEELRVDKDVQQVGTITARKHVDTHHASRWSPGVSNLRTLLVEEVEVDADSGVGRVEGVEDATES